MSCEVKLCANICDIDEVRRGLYPLDDARGSENWLLPCEISISPTGDVIAFTREKQVVVLTRKWNLNSSLSSFKVIYAETVNADDKVTSVLCLPVVGQGQSSLVGADWICIALGFESGYVRFYTDDCTLLLEQKLHNERVVSLKCQSQHSPRPDISAELKNEEIYIHYPSNVCILNGASFFNGLRRCRENLTKMTAFGGADTNVSQSTSLDPKKWEFVDQDKVNAIAVVGLDLRNTFDHLMVASTVGGFDSRYRSAPPQNTLILGAGGRPFLGFHYALEGGSQPILTDVAKAVASKIKSALPNWMTGAKPQPEKELTAPVQKAEPINCRYGLCDQDRTATEVILSPNNKLAAVSDTLGRVTLVDVHRGVAVRVFKGYRDAQCSFVQVPDEQKTKHRHQRRIALFLIIYSPKKGILEIFLAQTGYKVATFSASKYSRLIYINYSLMGFQNVCKTRYVCHYTCVLIDGDGQLKEFVIPFHFSLTALDSKKSKDLHLYKRLKQFLKLGDVKNHTTTLQEVLCACKEMYTAEVKLQTLHMLISHQEVFPEAISTCLNNFVEFESDKSDDNSKELKTTLENLRVLVDFYNYVTNEAELDVKNGNDNPEKSQLVLGHKERESLQKLLDLTTLNDGERREIKVRFENDSVGSLSMFLSIFFIDNENSITLKSNLKQQCLFSVAEMIFMKFITGNCGDTDLLKQQVGRSKISIRDLFALLLNYWVNRPLNIDTNLEAEMQNLGMVIHSLVQNVDTELLVVDYSCTSPFWTEVRSIIVGSSKPFPALMAAILSKSVANLIETENELEKSIEDEYEIWEKLSQEKCEWSLLIGKLEDVSLLNIVLANDAVSDIRNTSPKLKQEIGCVSLKYILEKGRGSVSELISKWFSIRGVSPVDIVINDKLYWQALIESEEDIPERPPVSDVEVMYPEDVMNAVRSRRDFQNVNLLRKQFPLSLNVNVLLVNLAWEYSSAWQRNSEQMDLLNKCLECLNEVTDTYLRIGTLVLIWNTHVKDIFERCCKFLNKVGKVAKERLCRQDTFLSDVQIVTFFKITTTILKTLVNSINTFNLANREKPVYNYEPIWETEGTPLTELAMALCQPNYYLVLLHYELSMATHMLTSFSIKYHKYMGVLFEPFMMKLFFVDLHSAVDGKQCDVESKVMMSRGQFVLRGVIESVEKITTRDDEYYLTDHHYWMNLCESLGGVWEVDIDEIKQYRIVYLYVHGFDKYAKDQPQTWQNRSFGENLFHVALRRVKHMLATSKNYVAIIAAFHPLLIRYMDKLADDWCAPTSLEDTLKLAEQSLRCLNESHSTYKLVKFLIDACKTILGDRSLYEL